MLTSVTGKLRLSEPVWSSISDRNLHATPVLRKLYCSPYGAAIMPIFQNVTYSPDPDSDAPFFYLRCDNPNARVSFVHWLWHSLITSWCLLWCFTCRLESLDVYSFQRSANYNLTVVACKCPMILSHGQEYHNESRLHLLLSVGSANSCEELLVPSCCNMSISCICRYWAKRLQHWKVQMVG